jgi:hypothetical protein
MSLRLHERPAWARLLIIALMLVGAVLAGLSAQSSPPQPATPINASTPFEYVAVFPADTTNAAIDTWRSLVVGRMHKQACTADRPCLRRLMRFSHAGSNAMELLAFDLDPATPDIERAAILAAAERIEPRARLLQKTSPHQVFNP